MKNAALVKNSSGIMNSSFLPASFGKIVDFLDTQNDVHYNLRINKSSKTGFNMTIWIDDSSPKLVASEAPSSHAPPKETMSKNSKRRRKPKNRVPNQNQDVNNMNKQFGNSDRIIILDSNETAPKLRKKKSPSAIRRDIKRRKEWRLRRKQARLPPRLRNLILPSNSDSNLVTTDKTIPNERYSIDMRVDDHNDAVSVIDACDIDTDSVSDNDHASVDSNASENSNSDHDPSVCDSVILCSICQKESTGDCGYCHAVDLCSPDCFDIHLQQSKSCYIACKDRAKRENIASD